MNQAMRILKLVLGTAIIIATLFGCSKYRYRNDYTGKWTFYVEKSSFNYDGAEGSTYEEFAYNGEIKTEGSDDKIKIFYAPDVSIVVKLGEDGNLDDLPNHYCSGNFKDTNELHLYIRYGGLGGNLSYSVNGKKK